MCDTLNYATVELKDNMECFVALYENKIKKEAINKHLIVFFDTSGFMTDDLDDQEGVFEKIKKNYIKLYEYVYDNLEKLELPKHGVMFVEFDDYIKPIFTLDHMKNLKMNKKTNYCGVLSMLKNLFAESYGVTTYNILICSHSREHINPPKNIIALVNAISELVKNKEVCFNSITYSIDAIKNDQLKVVNKCLFDPYLHTRLINLGNIKGNSLTITENEDFNVIKEYFMKMINLVNDTLYLTINDKYRVELIYNPHITPVTPGNKVYQGIIVGTSSDFTTITCNMVNQINKLPSSQENKLELHLIYYYYYLCRLTFGLTCELQKHINIVEEIRTKTSEIKTTIESYISSTWLQPNKNEIFNKISTLINVCVFIDDVLNDCADSNFHLNDVVKIFSLLSSFHLRRQTITTNAYSMVVSQTVTDAPAVLVQQPTNIVCSITGEKYVANDLFGIGFNSDFKITESVKIDNYAVMSAYPVFKTEKIASIIMGLLPMYINEEHFSAAWDKTSIQYNFNDWVFLLKKLLENNEHSEDIIKIISGIWERIKDNIDINSVEHILITKVLAKFNGETVGLIDLEHIFRVEIKNKLFKYKHYLAEDLFSRAITTEVFDATFDKLMSDYRFNIADYRSMFVSYKNYFGEIIDKLDFKTIILEELCAYYDFQYIDHSDAAINFMVYKSKNE